MKWLKQMQDTEAHQITHGLQFVFGEIEPMKREQGTKQSTVGSSVGIFLDQLIAMT
jgi:hypothetical protein